jgi:hypothetical protein
LSKSAKLTTVQSGITKEKPNIDPKKSKFILSSYLYWPSASSNSNSQNASESVGGFNASESVGGFTSYLTSFTTAKSKSPENQAPIKKALLTRQHIDNKTIKLVLALDQTSTSTDPSYIRRLEELCQHIYTHPDAKG